MLADTRQWIIFQLFEYAFSTYLGFEQDVVHTRIHITDQCSSFTAIGALPAFEQPICLCSINHGDDTALARKIHRIITPVSYTHLRAHETKTRIAVGGVGV